MTQNPFDFSKLKEIDKKKEVHLENVARLLDDNNLVRKEIADGPNRLFKAISDALFFTPSLHQEIQNACIKYLKILITNNKLPHRLNIFKGNNMLWKDYSSNPSLPGFEKINLELVSLVFQVRVILYALTEDYYLTSTIINNKFDKTIQMIRVQGIQFDSVHLKQFIAKAGICQNIILNIVDRIFTNDTEYFKNFNDDTYVNTNYRNWVANNEEHAKEGITIRRGHHKKSLSDNFNVNFETMEEQEIKFYNMFMTKKPPEDLMKIISNPNRKETDDNININSHLKFLEDNHEVSDSKNMAIKNYAINTSNLSSGIPSAHDLTFSNLARNITNPVKSNSRVFFDDNLSETEIERMQNNDSMGDDLQDRNGNQLSPSYFVNSPPPGLTPTRYPQKSYSTEQGTGQQNMQGNMQQNMQQSMQQNMQQSMQQSLQQSMQQSMQANHQQHLQNNLSLSGVFMHDRPMFMSAGHMMTPTGGDLPYSFANMGTPPPNSGAYADIFSAGKRSLMNSRSLTLSTQSDEFKIQQELYMDQMQRGLFLSGEKKKPIILDESKQRYTGRLKFFDESKNYGFIIMDEDGSDIFVHYDDLQKANISKELLKTARLGCTIKLSFSCMKYIGKYDRSRKATDIQLLKVEG